MHARACALLSLLPCPLLIAGSAFHCFVGLKPSRRRRRRRCVGGQPTLRLRRSDADHVELLWHSGADLPGVASVVQ